MLHSKNQTPTRNYTTALNCHQLTSSRTHNSKTFTSSPISNQTQHTPFVSKFKMTLTHGAHGPMSSQWKPTLITPNENTSRIAFTTNTMPRSSTTYLMAITPISNSIRTWVETRRWPRHQWHWFWSIYSFSRLFLRRFSFFFVKIGLQI